LGASALTLLFLSSQLAPASVAVTVDRAAIVSVQVTVTPSLVQSELVPDETVTAWVTGVLAAPFSSVTVKLT
jgi:hypothetical protein